MGPLRRVANIWKQLGILVSVAFVLARCGIPLGSGPPNDQAPSGTIVAQGAFTSLNGQAVSGTAIIYRVNGAEFIARLQGIAMPSGGGYQVRVINGSATVLSTALRATEGSQNYSFTVASPASWNSVDVYSPSAAANVSQALLVSTLPPGS